MKSIVSYSNYRLYLRDFYCFRKAKKQGYTYAQFSIDAGIKSPNYLKLVTLGEKNLTPINTVRFSKALGLNENDADIFEALVQFNQSKESIEKEYYRDRLSRLRIRSTEALNAKTLEEFEFEMMSSWLHHTLMVLTNVKSFLPSPVWIKEKLYELANEEEIVKALDQLHALGMLKRDENGAWKQTFKQVQTKPVLKRLSAKVFYEGIFKRSIEALSLGETEEREFATTLVGLSPYQVGTIKKRIREFMRELNDYAMENPEPDQVYSVTVSAFPMTKI